MWKIVIIPNVLQLIPYTKNPIMNKLLGEYKQTEKDLYYSFLKDWAMIRKPQNKLYDVDLAIFTTIKKENLNERKEKWLKEIEEEEEENKYDFILKR